MELREIMLKIKHLSTLHRYHLNSFSAGVRIYPGQPPILDYLMTNENCTQAELAEFLHVSPASVAMSIKRMQRAGLVAKRADESDLRCNRICITQQGIEQNNWWRCECEKIDNKMFAGFTIDEVATLSWYLDRLIANLSRDVRPEDMMDFMEQMKRSKRRERVEGDD